MHPGFTKDLQFYKFSLYGFLKNLRFFEPFLYLFFLEQGLNFLQIGALITIREITRNVLEIPAGVLADSLGRRRIMIMAFSFYIISFFVFYISVSYWLFIVAMFCYSFGDAFRTGTHKAMIFTYLKNKNWEDQKVWYYGYTRSASQFGSAISSLLAAFIVFYSGSYRYVFLFSTIPYVLDLLLMFSYPRELDGRIRKTDFSMIRENFRSIIKETKQSFRELRVFRTLTNTALFSGYFSAMKDYLQPVILGLVMTLPVLFSWNREQSTAVMIGLVYFILYILSAITSRNSGRIAGKFNGLFSLLNLSLIAGLFIGMAGGCFYILETPFWIIMSIIFFVAVHLNENLRKPVGVSYIADQFKEDILATVLSVESQVKSLYAALIAPVIGFMADRFGLGWGLAITSCLLLLVTPFIMIGKGKEGKKGIEGVKGIKGIEGRKE